MYIYETHQHTSACSACSVAGTVELINALHNQGLSGVVLTNHFLRGNSAINKKLPWKEFCAYYAKDYEVAKKEGEKLDFDVIFGVEEGVGNGKEVLIYGLLPEQFIKHPELAHADLATIYKVVHGEGGLVIQAHPFRNRSYITNPFEKLPVKYLDGFEVYNRANPDLSNNQALEYVRKMRKIILAGSDSHDLDNDYYRFGIGCEQRIRNEKELVKILKKGNFTLINNRKEL